MMAARITEPAVGASTWASGSQVWTGHIGTLTAKEAKNASHNHFCIVAGRCADISVGMSVVPVSKKMARIASSIRTEPAAQPCGTLASRYCTGNVRGSRGSPANSSGRWWPWNQEAAVKFAVDLADKAAEVCAPLTARVGMATGYALLFEGDDYIGSAVNLAARLCDAAGAGFARGLTNYSAADVQKIKGLKSDAIAAALSHCPYQEVIHRDNMALTGK